MCLLQRQGNTATLVENLKPRTVEYASIVLTWLSMVVQEKVENIAFMPMQIIFNVDSASKPCYYSHEKSCLLLHIDKETHTKHQCVIYVLGIEHWACMSMVHVYIHVYGTEVMYGTEMMYGMY